MKESRIKAIESLKKLLNGTLSIDDVLHQWPKDINDGALEQISALLEHYRADADIRAKDTRYNEYQRSEILEYIEMLTDNNT